MDEIPRYKDETFTPDELAQIRLTTAQLKVTHPHLPESFIDLLAKVAAISTDEELNALANQK
jgi:hypothetical protein